MMRHRLRRSKEQECWLLQRRATQYLLYGVFSLALVASVLPTSITHTLLSTTNCGLNNTIVEQQHKETDYELARRESLGFFRDIPSNEWNLRKASSRSRPTGPDTNKTTNYAKYPARWYATHWEPNFSCAAEELVGGLDDGHKWVCDPHRITSDECLVYSIGSRGNIRFETALSNLLPRCEVHVFDPTDYTGTVETVERTHFHAWGLAPGQPPDDPEAVLTLKNRTRPEGTFLSLQETVRRLGHEGRTIDVFKIDCDECEWSTFKDWLSFDLRQILVEVHDKPQVAESFFRSLRDAGYVIFHKEPNIEHNPNCIEYSFLKLSTEYMGS